MDPFQSVSTYKYEYTKGDEEKFAQQWLQIFQFPYYCLPSGTTL